ncbi:hypothetical protein M8C21_026995, partial [Ambrosia artemisiifolia]
AHEKNVKIIIAAAVVAAATTTVVEYSMERQPPPSLQPPQQPKESVVRAYIFTRPRKKDATKKDKKHTELPSAPDILDSERPAISPSPEPAPEPESTVESQWSKPFKW